MINFGLFAVLLAGLLFAGFFFGALWFIIAALKAMSRRRTGSLPAGEWGRRVDTRVCPARDCAKVNVSSARFCAQCGRRL